MPATRNVRNSDPSDDALPIPDFYGDLEPENLPMDIISFEFMEVVLGLNKESRSGGPNGARRPRNAFILYRCVYDMAYKRQGGSREQNNISRLAANSWNTLSPAQKKPYEKMALMEKHWYQVEFPTYSFNPGRRLGKPYKKPKRKTRGRSLTHSSATRSSVESDAYIPPPSLRRPSNVQMAPPVSNDTVVVKKELLESREHRHFDDDTNVDSPQPRRDTPRPSAAHRVDEQFGFRAGISPPEQTLAELNSTDDTQLIVAEIISTVVKLQPAPKKKKSKTKKCPASDVHSDWDLTSVQTVLDVDREMAFLNLEDHDSSSFLETDFGIPSGLDDVMSY